MRKIVVLFFMTVLMLLSYPALAGQKIVILYASLGNGHKTAAEAIVEQLKTTAPDAVVVTEDIFKFTPPAVTAAINKAFNVLAQKYPGLNDRIFNTYLNSQTELPQGLANLIRADQLAKNQNFLDFLKRENPNIIFSTFNHATEALIRLREMGKLKDVLAGSTLTDYITHPYYARIAMASDMTFIPSEDLYNYYIGIGVPPEKIRISGIPVHPSVMTRMTWEEKVSFLNEQGLNPDHPTVLLVSGSAGVGDFRTMVDSIVKTSSGENFNLVVVAGRNEEQFQNVSALLPEIPKNINVRLHRLIPHPQMLGLMKSANIIVTKSGGLSVTEVSAMGKPVIYLDINGGQERFNANYFRESGMAWTTQDQSEVGKLVFELMQDQLAQQSMIKAQRKMMSSLDLGSISRWMADNEIATNGLQPVMCPAVLSAKAK